MMPVSNEFDLWSLEELMECQNPQNPQFSDKCSCKLNMNSVKILH